MASLSVLVVVGQRADQVEATVISLRAQTDPGWELVAVVGSDAASSAKASLTAAARTEPRVRVHEVTGSPSPVRAGNDALARARGPWVTFVEPGDELHRHAVARVGAVGQIEDVDFVYSDEDRLDGTGDHSDPWFKPDWSPDRLRAQHYTGGLAAFRRTLVERIGGLRPEVEGAHHHDLALRAGERARQVAHIPAVLYHRRILPSDDDAAAVQAVADHVARTGVGAEVEPHPDGAGLCRLRPGLLAEPLVSIVIPTACASRRIRGELVALAGHCVESILERSTYPHYEIVCVVDDDVDPSARADLVRAGGDRLRIVPYPHEFDFSRKINLGVLASRGEFVALLNDDTEVITPEWIEQLLMYAQQEGVGAVGARLLFGDGRIQHAGIAAVWGRAGHPYYGFPGDHPGYFDNALVPIDVLAVTAACLMTRRSCFEEVGGLSRDFPLNYNDVDFCLKLRRAGYRIVCNPDARLWHLEAATRRTGTVDQSEVDALHNRWGHVLNHDPFYNPHFLPWSVDYIPPLYLPDGRPVLPPEPPGLYWLRDALNPAV